MPMKQVLRREGMILFGCFRTEKIQGDGNETDLKEGRRK
jgi:hypothetical protein